MATNTGVKIVREFLRDSPCRMAYAVAQRSFQQKPRRIPSKKLRPQTAPVCPSNLSRAVTAHQLLLDGDGSSGSRRRPTTSGRPLKPAVRDRSRPPPKHRHREDSHRKTGPSGPSSTSLRKRPQQQQTSKTTSNGAKPPFKPCKICNEDRPPAVHRWPTLLGSLPSQPPKSEFRALIGKIQTIRTELLEKSGGTGLRDSLQLINEIRQRMDLPKSESSFLDRLEPGQTQRLVVPRTDSALQKRKSVKSIHFEGGRIAGKDYAGYRKEAKKMADGRGSKLRLNAVVKPSRKQIDDGPLRKLMVPMLARKEFSEKRVRF